MRKAAFFPVFPVVIGFAVGLRFARADEPQFIPKAGEEVPKPVQDMGFNPWVTIGANVSFGHNRSVVGKVDGQNWTLGGRSTPASITRSGRMIGAIASRYSRPSPMVRRSTSS